MRERIVSELVKEVLGPRFGSEEILEASPLAEYITGILAPVNAGIDKEAEVENLIGDMSEAEEEQIDVSVAAYPNFSPALNPLRQPSSMGISFVLKSREGNPQISICATWGRYKPLERKSWKNLWKRKSCYMIIKVLTLKPGMRKRIIPEEANYSNANGDKVSLMVYSREMGGDFLLVSVFLCNEEKEERRNPASKYIFQPQIRIRCENGTELYPFLHHIKPLYKNDEEDRVLDFLFRKTPVMARGHMCAVVWKGVDPETSVRLEEDDEAESRRPRAPPFFWVDGEVLPPKIRDEFKDVDLRTEFVPVYHITMPELEWNDRYGKPPVFDASKLAECWNPKKLRESLMPLVEGYEKWIKEGEKEVEKLSGEEREIARGNMIKHRTALARINRAIDLLLHDEDSRLAFCFSNKVMDLQRRWRERITGEEKGLKWRPFQLAFILLNIPSIAGTDREDRNFCDLLWVPTGSGKTEAYLGIAAFTMAYRRRKALRRGGQRSNGGAGTAVLTRYTLRLLTIQQFRRALRMVTACEYLRVYGLGQGPVGWRPADCHIKDDFLWGSSRFSIGLWVGGEMTPNSLLGTITYRRNRGTWKILGAVDILRDIRGEGRGEPAQIINCPCCNSLISIPEKLERGEYTIHLVFSTEGNVTDVQRDMFRDDRVIHIVTASLTSLGSRGNRNYYTLSLNLKIEAPLTAANFDNWWENIVRPSVEQIARGIVTLECARPSRLGYFLRKLRIRNRECYYDFDIFCPNPACDLNKRKWCEGCPCGLTEPSLPEAPDFNEWSEVSEVFRDGESSCVANRIPIPAYTVDDQIYHRCPTMVVATVDKFARLPFEPKAASLFGNIDRYHRYYGYYRKGIPPKDCIAIQSNPRNPLDDPRPSLPHFIVDVEPMNPPDLIIQDELHLIEGPLGSLVGIYETAIDVLCSRGDRRVKYIASTATIRRASEQVKAVFLRELFVFPPPALDASDFFFLKSDDAHPLNEEKPGRLYVGICAPGKGAQTPLLRIWALLLQYVYHLLRDKQVKPEELDPYWTIVGYFNAIRELAGAIALYKQDVIGRLQDLSGRYGSARLLPDHIELSSRIGSTALPVYLDVLEKKSLLKNQSEEVPVAIFTTNIFGVGVDIPRLGLMIVHGQPKTTSAYIQATGRIGRRNPGIVITFYKATRPRDLSHYEYFIGYHSMLHRFVEPITVYPFAPRVRDRANGPLMVALLRCAREIERVIIPPKWGVEQKLRAGYYSGAPLMRTRRYESEIEKIVEVIRKRGEKQPDRRRPDLNELDVTVQSCLDQWHIFAISKEGLIYWEKRPPGARRIYPSVLGDFSSSTGVNMDVVFENVPQSLRDIEETVGIEVP